MVLSCKDTIFYLIFPDSEYIYSRIFFNEKGRRNGQQLAFHLAEFVKDSDFKVFSKTIKDGGVVKAINAKGAGD